MNPRNLFAELKRRNVYKVALALVLSASRSPCPFHRKRDYNGKSLQTFGRLGNPLTRKTCAQSEHAISTLPTPARAVRGIAANRVSLGVPSIRGEARLELGYISTVDSQGRTIWIADALRGDGKRFIVHADEKLTAFVELEG